MCTTFRLYKNTQSIKSNKHERMECCLSVLHLFAWGAVEEQVMTMMPQFYNDILSFSIQTTSVTPRMVSTRKVGNNFRNGIGISYTHERSDPHYQQTRRLEALLTLHTNESPTSTTASVILSCSRINPGTSLGNALL